MLPLIIGVGNPLRGDDGVGPAVARAAGVAPGEATVLTPHQLLPEMAGQVAGASLVLFVDAATDLPPGGIRCRRIHGTTVVSAGHLLPPDALLGLGLAVFAREPDAWLIEVGARSFDHGDLLSPAVARAVPGAAVRLRSLLPCPTPQPLPDSQSPVLSLDQVSEEQ